MTSLATCSRRMFLATCSIVVRVLLHSVKDMPLEKILVMLGFRNPSFKFSDEEDSIVMIQVTVAFVRRYRRPEQSKAGVFQVKARERTREILLFSRGKVKKDFRSSKDYQESRVGGQRPCHPLSNFLIRTMGSFI